VHEEILESVVGLVKIAAFIQDSSILAYHATKKSFGYIIRILSIIVKNPKVDRDEIKTCLDKIQKKRKELMDVLGVDEEGVQQ